MKARPLICEERLKGSPDLQRVRDLLGDEATGMTDEQVSRISRHADVVARAVVDAYLDSLTKQAA